MCAILHGNSPRLLAVVLRIGAVVGTVVPVASDVDDAVDEDNCGDDMWLVMSCHIHSCCSSINPFSNVDDRALPLVTLWSRLLGRGWRGIRRRLFRNVLPLLQVSIATGCECTCACYSN